MQHWSKSLPSLSGNTDQAPKAPVQQMLGTPRRGDIQCLGRDGRCFRHAVTSQQHCQHSSGTGAAWNHSCELGLPPTKSTEILEKRNRDNTSADAGDCKFCLTDSTTSIWEQRLFKHIFKHRNNFP